jgi:S-adenosylmethionine synthetase
VEKQFVSPDGKTIKRKVELFTWEKLDYVAKIKKAFGLK